MAPLPPSIYAETARPAIATPSLDGDRRCAVAIVGGGYTGLSVALHLAQGGADVTVIEAHEPGWGASGRNGGQVNPGLKHDPDQVERDFGPDLGARMAAFAGAAADTVFGLIRAHGIDCEARQGGTLRAAYAVRHVPALEATAAQWQRRGAPVAMLDRTGIGAATASGRYIAAMLDRRGGTLNPLGYARGLAEAAMRAGATVHGDTPALRLIRRGARWRVETPRGAVEADHVVLATNAYSDNLWPGLRRTIVPVFSGILASEPLPPALAARILAEGQSLYECGDLTVYFRVDKAGRLLMGGRSPMRDIADARGLRWLVGYTERLWPELAGLGWTHGWNGRVAVTLDHYPHLHRPADNVTIGLGYNGRGVAMATAMGVEIARHVLGMPMQERCLPVTDVRTIPFHALWPAGAALRVAYARLRDRFGV